MQTQAVNEVKITVLNCFHRLHEIEDFVEHKQRQG